MADKWKTRSQIPGKQGEVSGNNANLVGQVQCVLCDFSLKEGLRFSVPGDILLARDGGCKELMVQSSLLSDKVDHNANKHYDSNALALIYDRSI